MNKSDGWQLAKQRYNFQKELLGSSADDRDLVLCNIHQLIMVMMLLTYSCCTCATNL